MKGTAMPNVRTTINPLKEIEVTPQEFAALQADGLILKTQATTADGLVKAAESQVADFVQPGGYDDAPANATPAESVASPSVPAPPK
jgi:hypothetical protein